MSLANAIIHGDESTVAALLNNGADPNEIDEYGFRPLIEAAIVNKPSMAQLLLDKGAQVDEEDTTGRTALHWAVENNNLALCELLLEKGANVNHYTRTGQPVMVTPLLRGQTALKNLLYKYRIDLDFNLDYIHTKLVGHRFALGGQTDIIDPRGRFVALDLEGFFLEFTVNVIFQSLQRYRYNFGARTLRPYFHYFGVLLEALSVSAQLIKFQQYLINIDEYAEQINALLRSPLLILPVAHRGHAITFIRYGHLFIKCDRGENSFTEGSVTVYRVRESRLLNPAFFRQLLYVCQSPDFIEHGYQSLLKTERVICLPLPSQIAGNCSWANVEAAVPASLFLLMASETDHKSHALRRCMDDALLFYHQWCEWDQDRALYEVLESFAQAKTMARKASKAALLGAVLFQCCHAWEAKSIERAEKILPVFKDSLFRYVLDTYIAIYYRQKKTLAGENLIALLDMCGFSWA